MTDTAIVLFVKHSGHVLATVTRTGDPAAAPKPDELAGELFPVRDENGDVLVEVEPGQLDTKVVPFEEDLIANPQGCGVTDDAAQLLAGAPPSTVTLSGTKLKVTVAQNVAEKTPVWAQVDFGTGQTRRHEVLTGEIPAQQKTVDLAKSFPGGQDYDVLVLVKGCERAELIDEPL